MLQLQLTGFDFGKIQDFPDGDHQVQAGRLDGLHQIPLLIAHSRFQQQAGHAEDAVEGGADLMAHVRQELAFRLFRRFGVSACRDERRLRQPVGMEDVQNHPSPG